MSYTIKLEDAFKQFTLDQDKIFPPGETVQRLKEKLKVVNLDVLRQTERIDNGRLGIPVFFSICGDDALEIIGTKKQMGKGATPEQAEASAVMELTERFSFFSFSKNPANFITETYKNLSGPKIPFEHIAQSVHDDSEDLEISRSIFETLPLKWTWAYNLTTKEPVQVPFDWFFMINEFNGPSAGNCVEEALSQGICEIVERHVSSIISRQKLSIAAIRPESATDTMVKEMLQKYDKIGVNLYVSDFSLDTGIPSVGVMAYDPTTFQKTSEIVWTAGTTPCPQKAFSRALSEVAQLAGDFNTSSNYVASGLPKFTTLEEADYIMSSAKTVDINALPDLSDNNIKKEVENCIQALFQKGMQVYAINTMHSKLEVPAFYSIIPGAHFRERALGTSVAMFSAKMIAENQSPMAALNSLQEIDAKLPGKYYVQFYMGNCHLAMESPDSALGHFSKALSLNPNSQDVPSIYSYMGVCLKDLGQYRDALSVLQKGAALDDERTDIFNLMGFCHFMLKDHEAAIENFEKVIKLDPSSAIDYANIASNYRDMGQPEKAIRYYELALELDPTIDFARDNLMKLTGD